jgi:subtilisin family serine protease
LHGTHVAGTIGATGNNSIGVAGVNWAVPIVPVKYLGANLATTDMLIRAIDYLTDLKRAGVANVVAINNSHGLN